MSTTAWSTGIPLNDVQEPAVKEAPADDLIAANDFKIKAFGADPQEAQINPASDVISSLERKESLPKTVSASPRGERKSEVNAGKTTASVPVHQRLHEYGQAHSQKREEAAAKQASELTFMPELSPPRSRNMSASGRLSTNGKAAHFSERLSSVGTEAQKRLDRLRQERADAEHRTCTFQPKVNSYSDKLLMQRASRNEGSAQDRQQAFLKKMNQTFGGSTMRTSGYGNPAGVNQSGSASIGGSARSRQLTQRRSLVGCDATPAMMSAAAAAAAGNTQDLSDKMKRQLQALYGIKPREETPLEEIERWYKAALQEQSEVDAAAHAAHQAALADSLKEIEAWWKAACNETEGTATAAASVAAAEAESEKSEDAKSPADVSMLAADLKGDEETPADVGDNRSDNNDSALTGVAAAAADADVTAEVTELLEVKEQQLIEEITQLDEALQEVKAAAPAESVFHIAESAVTSAESAVVSSESAVTSAESAVAPVSEKEEEQTDQQQQSEEISVALTATVVETAGLAVSKEEAASVQLSTGSNAAAIQHHVARINAAMILRGSRTRSAIKSHMSKIKKALKKGASSNSISKVQHHTAAMAAAIQENSIELSEEISHHSTHIASLTEDAAAAAAIEQHAAKVAADAEELSSSMAAAKQQSPAAVMSAAARFAESLSEYAALTAAILGKHGSSIAAALRQLASRIVAALRLSAVRIASVMKKFHNSIGKAGLQLPSSAAGHHAVQVTA